MIGTVAVLALTAALYVERSNVQRLERELSESRSAQQALRSTSESCLSVLEFANRSSQTCIETLEKARTVLGSTNVRMSFARGQIRFYERNCLLKRKTHERR